MRRWIESDSGNKRCVDENFYRCTMYIVGVSQDGSFKQFDFLCNGHIPGGLNNWIFSPWNLLFNWSTSNHYNSVLETHKNKHLLQICTILSLFDSKLNYYYASCTWCNKEIDENTRIYAIRILDPLVDDEVLLYADAG